MFSFFFKVSLLSGVCLYTSRHWSLRNCFHRGPWFIVTFCDTNNGGLHLPHTQTKLRCLQLLSCDCRTALTLPKPTTRFVWWTVCNSRWVKLSDALQVVSLPPIKGVSPPQPWNDFYWRSGATKLGGMECTNYWHACALCTLAALYISSVGKMILRRTPGRQQCL